MSQINVNTIRNRTGGPPSLDKGAVVTGIVTATSGEFAGDVTVGGTLTYEDVTNIDSTGIVTAKSGIKVGNPVSPGIGATIDPNGNAVFAGIVTATSGQFAGRLGIGVEASSSEGTELVVKGSDGATNFGLVPNADTESTNISFYNAAYNSQQGYIKYNNNDNSLQVRVNLGERIRIGSAGQIGLGGANYGTSGQVITSAGSGSAPSWAAIPPAGNTFTGIASGSIANNKCVKVCHDGKLLEISAVETPTTSVSAVGGGGGWLNSTDTLQASAAWNPRDKIVYFGWQQNSNRNVYLTWYKADTSGGTLVYKGQVQLNTTTVSDANEGAFTMTYDTTNNHVIVMYNETGGTNGWKYRIGTPSGTDNEDITLSNQETLQASVYYGSCCFEPTQGKLVLFYRDDSDGDDPKVRVAQLSGTAGSVTATWGTGVKIDGTSYNVSPGKRFDIIAASNSRVLYSWSRTTSALQVGAATINSDNSVTNVSGPSQISGDGEYSRVAWDWSKDRGVVSYRDNNQSSHAYSTVIDLTSYPTVNKGSAVQIGSITSVERNDMVYNAKVENVYYFYRSAGSGGATKGIQAVVTASGNTISWTADGTINGGSDGKGKEWAPWNAADPSTKTGAYAYASGAAQRSSASRGTFYTAKLSDIVSNLKSQNEYVGFAAQAYTDGQTATINTYGNLVTTLSGLTTTSLYYVQSDGTVATTADGSLSGYFLSGTPVAGTAINYTTLVIRDPTTRV